MRTSYQGGEGLALFAEMWLQGLQPELIAYDALAALSCVMAAGAPA